MDCTSKIIIRTSIHTFLKHFHYFTTIPLLLLLPFSASVLLSQTLFKPQTVLLPFLLTFPFAISSFVMAKASIIQALINHHHNNKPPTLKSLNYRPLLFTHLCSVFVIVAIKSAATFNSLLFVPLQSFLLPYTFIVSNLALVVAGNVGTCKAHVAIYKACCLLIRKGKNSVALLLLFLPANLGFVAVEALFRFRVMRVYRFSGRVSGSMALEGLLIAYLYSILIVVDTIICCLFYKSCEPNCIASDRIQRSCCNIDLCTN